MSEERAPAPENGPVIEATCAVVLEPIPRDRVHVLDALFELYAHDFSEYVPLELKESGRFELSAGELWWQRADHHPFFLRASGRLAGFALVRRGSMLVDAPDVMDVAEFFVVRGERRKRTGQAAALALLRRFPGRWEVRVRQSNLPAVRFWSQVLRTLTGAAVDSTPFSRAGVAWQAWRAEAR